MNQVTIAQCIIDTEDYLNKAMNCNSESDKIVKHTEGKFFVLDICLKLNTLQPYITPENFTTSNEFPADIVLDIHCMCFVHDDTKTLLLLNLY